MANEIKLISGSSHPELSAKVASRYVCTCLAMVGCGLGFFRADANLRMANE